MLNIKRTIDASPDDAWYLLTDTTTWPQWGPSIAEVEHVGRYIHPHSKGRVRTPVGVWLPFRIDGFDARTRCWTWRIGRLPATHHEVDAVPGEPGRCVVTFGVPWYAPVYAVVCRRALARIEERLTGKSPSQSRGVRRLVPWRS